ncbi:MAG: SpoIID/LytB domain-containing protein [Bacillota bacterium]|nr:SpoIID/LytB domain-containing protein [Bacillota bacterium]
MTKHMHRRCTSMLVSLICALVLVSLLHDSPSYADSGDLSNSIFRVGLHHGANSLQSVKLSYSGKVQFFTPDWVGGQNVLLEDDGGAWQVHRESINLEVGPFESPFLAEQTLARWPKEVSPAYIVREPEGFYVVGGQFFTVEQAWMSIPFLNTVGIPTAQVRGKMSLSTVNALSLDDAVMLRDQLLASLLRARLYYDGAWKVVVGTSTDASGVSTLREILSQLMPEVEWVLSQPDHRRIEVTRQDGTFLFSYANFVSKPLRVQIASGMETVMAVENIRHRGVFEFILNQDNRFIVVSLMDIDDYLKAVVPREVSATWPSESLKAQAVVARTYAYANRGKHAAEGFDICTFSTHCQAYGAVDWERESTSRAVDETKGVVLFFNGRPAATYYHSDAGGHSENVENVWSTPIPYLVGVPDPYGAMAGSPHSSWQIELTQQQMQSIVQHNGGDVGTILSLRTPARYLSGRVAELLISGTRGSLMYTKQQPRLLNGTSALFALRSTMYTVAVKSTPVVVASAQGQVTLSSLQNAYVATASGVSQLPVASQYSVRGSSGTTSINAVPTSFVFNGSGWGHGVGMSQWGAKGMAELGHSYTEILLHYYRGIDIVTTMGR